MTHRSAKTYVGAAAILGTIVLFIVAFAITAPHRYGGNPNNYDMMRSWQVMIAKGLYSPSRYQGNLPTEVIFGYLASMFGPIGTNSFSLVSSIAALALLFVLFRQLETDLLTVGLALAAILANPFWMLASITSMDYIQPIPVYLAAILLLQKRLPILATILFALAGAMRISYAPLGLFALGYAFYFEVERARKLAIVQSLVLFIVLLGYMYVPALISAHLTLAFLTSARPEWQGLFIWTVRWVYKLIYLYGLIGMLLVGLAVIGFVVTEFSQWRLRKDVVAYTPDADARRHFHILFILAALFHLALFFYIPVRIEYLIPLLIAVVGLMIYYKTSQWLIIALTLAELSYAFVSIDVLRIDHLNADACGAVVPTAARFSPHLVPGVLYEELTGTSNELQCYPQLLLEAPAHIDERLPWPARR